ncbi:MAG: radical SAM protein, partial [Deltaproteobacteria bacterium]|nr:radical SAM protein [Deltaproteobacteria bacterium]
MPNILLTNYCNLNCPYCFAGKMMSRKGNNISVHNFKKAVSYLKKNREKHVGIIGGEPTLHPRFLDLMTYVIEQGFKVQLFTNGVMDEE